MRLPRRGVLIRLFIYLPLLGFLGWRAYQARCGEPTAATEPAANDGDPLGPYRKTIVLPDGSQQEIVEMTPEQAEAVLGHPLPPELDAEAKAEPSGREPAAGAEATKVESGADGDAASGATEVPEGGVQPAEVDDAAAD